MVYQQKNVHAVYHGRCQQTPRARQWGRDRNPDPPEVRGQSPPAGHTGTNTWSPETGEAEVVPLVHEYALLQAAWGPSHQGSAPCPSLSFAEGHSPSVTRSSCTCPACPPRKLTPSIHPSWPEGLGDRGRWPSAREMESGTRRCEGLGTGVTGLAARPPRAAGTRPPWREQAAGVEPCGHQQVMLPPSQLRAKTRAGRGPEGALHLLLRSSSTDPKHRGPQPARPRTCVCCRSAHSHLFNPTEVYRLEN